MEAATEQNDLNHIAHHSAKNNHLSLSILAFTGIKKKISIVTVVSQRNKFLHFLQGNQKKFFFFTTEHKEIAPGSNSILPRGPEVINKHLLTNHAASCFLSEMASVVQIQKINKS